MGLEGYVAGVDVLQGGQLIGRDVTEQAIVGRCSRALIKRAILVTPSVVRAISSARQFKQISPRIVRAVGLSKSVGR